MRQVLVAAAAAAFLAVSANANFVVNGGFELPINAVNGWTTNSGFTQNPFGGSVIAHGGSFYTGATSSSNATRTNTLSQVLALSAGNVVDFGMWYELASTSALASITVTLDGNTIFSITPGAVNNLVWTNVAVSGITINNNNPTLTISQTIGGRTNTFLLDDVSVNVVPAPASALLGLGTLSLMGRRRR